MEEEEEEEQDEGVDTAGDGADSVEPANPGDDENFGRK